MMFSDENSALDHNISYTSAKDQEELSKTINTNKESDN